MRRALLLFVTALAALGSLARADSESDWFVPLGRPPQAPPKRISGGEGFPPLPLPATPLRRSERKRDPTPPALFGKVVWGEQSSFTYQGGTTTQISDWNLCPADLQGLFGQVRNRLGLQYGFEDVSLPTFSGDPDKMPLLFFSGTRTLKLDAQSLAQLRAYVLRGGMLCFDSVAGSPYFYGSARALMQQAFPELAWHVVPPDHPLYHMLDDIKTVHYSPNVASNKPQLEALYVGSRIGVLLSRYGLGCGWDDHPVPLLKDAAYYDVGSAHAIGTNLVAYVIGYNRVGLEEARPELFGAVDEKTPTDEFVFAQIEHEGAYNVHPNNAGALLAKLRTATSLRVNLKREVVDLGKDDISNLSFLYLTGLDDFHLSDGAVAALRGFLQRNGTLFINNGLGLSTFDSAVRRELARVLPGAQLQPIPPSHALFSSVVNVASADYTPAVAMRYGQLKVPKLEGITLNGDVRVIYSPIDLEAGWEPTEYPMALAYRPGTATPLGMNILMYAATH
ncbi:MAG: DUF4159 domain-containing protein [Verrucomicrobiota bacterium]